jgi:Kef-type K+ transport system membrane component KefB
MLLTAVIFGQIARRFRQPAVLGELIGGIVLGPTIFGHFAPGTFAWWFPADSPLLVARDAIIRVGMLFFLFVAGLEVKLKNIRHRKKQVPITAVFGLLVPMALGIGSVQAFPGVWGRPAESGGWVFSVFVGTALSISALPVIARILMDLRLIREELGIIVITAAALDDVVGWSLFAILLNVLMPARVSEAAVSWETLAINLALLVGFVVVMLFAGGRLSRPSLHWMKANVAWPSAFIGVSAAVIMGAAAVTETLGIHAVFGAYVVGIAVGQAFEAGEENEAHEVIHQFAVSFFAPLYFVSIGQKANFVKEFDAPLVLLVLLVACIGKIGGAGFGARLSGMPSREALAVGFGLNARGAMEIILASVALESGLIDQRVFVALVVMAVVTSALAGPMMSRLMAGNNADS